MSDFYHVSVLLDECIEALNIKPDGIYVDGTLGGAGHSCQIAKRLTTGKLIGIDRDKVALQAAGQRLQEFGDRVELVHSNFSRLRTVLEERNIAGVDGILLDLGVSSFLWSFSSGSVLYILLCLVYYLAAGVVLLGTSGGYLPGKLLSSALFAIPVIIRLFGLDVFALKIDGLFLELSVLLQLASLFCLTRCYKEAKRRAEPAQKRK